ncbi:hypothetical protein MHYP_G00343020 [Metynnis hypsauchen]
MLIVIEGQATLNLSNGHGHASESQLYEVKFQDSFLRRTFDPPIGVKFGQAALRHAQYVKQDGGLEKMGSLLIGLLLLLVPQTSDCLQLTVHPAEASTVNLSTSLPLDQCSICEFKDQVVGNCFTSLKIGSSENVTVHLNCTEPRKAISVQIENRIECTKTDCTPERGIVPASFLSGFNRKFVWELMAPAETTLAVNFSEYGLKKVAEGDTCDDGYRYTVDTKGSDAKQQSQPYCRNVGSAYVTLPNQATLTLLVSQQEELPLSLFTVMPQPPQKRAIVPGQSVKVTPEPNTRVIISRKQASSDCTVCVGEGPSQTCAPEQTLSESLITTVDFSCSKPQDVFSVEVNRDLDCSKDCNYNTIHPESSIFEDFDRTFTWDMKVAPSMAFQLDFPAPGMRQIPSSDHCPDKHTYTILMYARAGAVSLGTFCRNGTISRMQVLYKGRVTLEVPRDTDLISSDFKYSRTSGSASAVVDATLPRGQTNTDFFSARDIPSDSVMKWNFVVPPMHNFTIQFLSCVKPECQSKEVKVTYQQNKVSIEKALTDEQPTNYQGDFSLSLKNCDAVRKAGVAGFSLSYRVSVFRSGYPDNCTVDLQRFQGLSLQIENTNPASFCEFRMDSVVQEKIVVPAGSKVNLSFLDCPSDELLLTATQTIECQNLSSCSVNGILLTIPSLDLCLPTPLRQFRWDLRVPEQGSVELSSPQGSLHQSVPEQECDGSVSLLVSDTDGSNIGRFCYRSNQGTIQKVQIFSNVTISAKADGTKDLSQQQGSIFNISFKSEITETLIYTVSPLVSTSVLLATPSWPGAMQSDSTVSWIVTIPEEYSAELLFINVSQPRCERGHTRVAIQEMGSSEEESFREDERYNDKYDIQSSFYLNMSNCEPEHGTFAALSKISLQKKTRKLLSIILAVVGALLAVMVIILAVVCVVVRKKKRLINRSSIYIPKGPVSLPGDASYSKNRGENDSPVYASIDDTMVYGHLLAQDGHTDRRPGNFNGQQVGTYRTFTGPMETSSKESGCELDSGQGPEKDAYRPFLAPSETFIPARPRTPLDAVDSMGWDRRMMDNELYTFKNPADPNPIRLSAVEPLPPPEPEDSWSESDEAEPQYDMPDM